MEKRILAKDYGITAGSDVTAAMRRLLTDMRADDSEKTLVIEPGEYFINSDEAVSEVMHVTNTVGDNEWRAGEKRYVNHVAIDVNGVKNLRIEAKGAYFTMRGQLTNIAIRNSENIEVIGIGLGAEKPDMHELKVIGRGGNHIDFELDAESDYVRRGGRFYFVGKDYRTYFKAHSATAYWNAKIPRDNENSIWRVTHPLSGAYRIKELAPRRFRAYYFIVPGAETGDRFCVFDARRSHQGVFIDRSKKVSLVDIEQNFNYGLSIVCQDSEDIAITGCRLAPREDGPRKMASVADFVQVCMCRGKIVIKNNTFIGAGDDTLNVHGIHFPAVKVGERQLRLRFAHRQTHGFLPFRAGDRVKYIDRATMLEKGFNEVESAELVSDKVILLTLKEPVSVARTIIENISATPDSVEFTDNFMTRIITRGILATTSNVRIENNVFDNTSMHSILLSDDAWSWYESGRVDSMIIRNNTFGRTVGYTVQVMPENRVHAGYVHTNIVIEGNTIDSNGEGGFYFKSAGGVTVKNNTIIGKTRKTYIKNSEFIDSDIEY